MLHCYINTFFGCDVPNQNLHTLGVRALIFLNKNSKSKKLNYFKNIVVNEIVQTHTKRVVMFTDYHYNRKYERDFLTYVLNNMKRKFYKIIKQKHLFILACC